MMREPIEAQDVIAGVQAFVHELESGYRPVPVAGQGLRRVAGCPVVPAVIHHALCGWRVFSRQDETDPSVVACAGCGLGMAAIDVETTQ